MPPDKAFFTARITPEPPLTPPCQGENLICPLTKRFSLLALPLNPPLTPPCQGENLICPTDKASSPVRPPDKGGWGVESGEIFFLIPNIYEKNSALLKTAFLDAIALEPSS